jgi:hypothetical protein
MLAPAEAIGVEQIIPSTGPHEQILVGHEQVVALHFFEAIDYDPEYGPGAKVYRPVGLADAATIRGWLA